jgi:unsaturated rhamnogalacturonyl hydrolase
VTGVGAIIAQNERRLVGRGATSSWRDAARPLLGLLQRASWRLERWSGALSLASDWPHALAITALVARHAASGDRASLARAEAVLSPMLRSDGGWRRKPGHVAQALYAESLLHLLRAGSQVGEAAVHETARFLIETHPRAGDGCLPYVAEREELLVDTIGMVCPFLAAYGRNFNNAAATSLALRHLTCFLDHEIDGDSALPYHGYRAGGPYRLGLQGWGRGVGWFLLGLAATLGELPLEHHERPRLFAALERSARSLMRYQRPDGHWSWVVVLPGEQRDSSATAFCGYALARAMRSALLPAACGPMLDRALAAIVGDALPDGRVAGASGECRGLGNYSMLIGPPQPFCDAAAAAFAALWQSGLAAQGGVG